MAPEVDDLFGEEWETEESSQFRAPIHPFDGKVKRAAFLTDPMYQGGANYRLILGVDVSKPGETAVLKADHEIPLTLGKGDWFSPDGGKTIEMRSGGTKFPPQSVIGRAIVAIAKAGKGGDENARSLARRGSLRTAANWIGVTFRFEDVEMFAGKDEATGAEKTKPFEIPLGVVSVEGSAGAAASNGSGNGDLEEKARALAASSATFEDFKEAAMDAGFAGDVAFFKGRILNEGGVWAEVKANA